MTLRALLAVLLLGLCASAACADVKTYGLEDCFAGATTATQACRMKVKAAYQAVQFAQVRHHLPNKICDFGAGVGTDRLLDGLRQDLLAAAAAAPDVPIAVLTVGMVIDPLTCPKGTARQIDGFAAGQVLNLCKLSPPQGGFDVCLAYIAALRDALAAVSLYDGVDKFVCLPPHTRLVTDKEAASLLIEEIKRDPKAQQVRPAAEVMAEALARRYPCQ